MVDGERKWGSLVREGWNEKGKKKFADMVGTWKSWLHGKNNFHYDVDEQLKDKDVEDMSQIICDCLKSFTGWIKILEALFILENPQEKYGTYLR